MGIKVPRAVYREISFWGLTLKDLVVIIGILFFGFVFNIDSALLLVLVVMAIGMCKLAIRFKEELHGIFNFKIYPERMVPAEARPSFLQATALRRDL